MSNVDPFGTWQYAHNVWRPEGARVASTVVACTTIMYGRSTCLPSQTSRSACEISRNDPPRCSVHALAQAGARHPNELARRHVAEHGARLRQLIECLDASVAHDLAADGSEIVREHVGQPLRSAAHDRPTIRVRGDDQRETISRRRHAVDRHDAVGGDACEHRASALVVERGLGKSFGGPNGLPAEAGEQHRLPYAERAEQCEHEVVGAVDEWRDELAIFLSIRGAERVGRLIEGASADDCGPVVERMRERRVGVNELDAALGERKRCEER